MRILPLAMILVSIDLSHIPRAANILLADTILISLYNAARDASRVSRIRLSRINALVN